MGSYVRFQSPEASERGINVGVFGLVKCTGPGTGSGHLANERAGL